MWIYLPFGFYSVVQKPGEKDLTVRTRIKGDLDLLREKYLPELGPTIEGAGTDYQCRARVSHANFAAGLVKIAMDVNYSNVKSETKKVSGSHRYDVYYAVHTETERLA